MKTRSAIILGTIVVIVGGLVTLSVLTLLNSKGCGQIVIDTNELHSGIDIPRVDFVNCYFDDRQNTRVSIYKLKLNDFHLNTYIRHNNLRLINRPADFRITVLEIEEQPVANQLYEARGVTWNNEWKYVLEKETGNLWVQIIYH